MRNRLFAVSAALALAGAFCISQAPRAQVMLPLMGAGGPRGSAPPSFTGPADIVAAPFIWGGLRAVSAAYASSAGAALDICDVATGSICSTVGVLASTGKFDKVAAAALPQCASACNVARIWDQTGVSCNWDQSTNSLRPLLVFNFLGTQPAIHFVGASTQSLLTPCNITQSAPTTVSAVMNIGSGDLFYTGDAQVFELTCCGANNVRMSGTNDISVTYSTWHAMQTLLVATGGGIYVDGSLVPNNVGSSAASWNTRTMGLGGAILSGPGEFYLMEIGAWATQFTTTGGGQADQINTNQHSATNGYNF